MPNGEHEEFDEMEFEKHLARHGDVSRETLTIMKEASRRKAAFLFERCPFCSGYPDILEKRFPDPDRPKLKESCEDIPNSICRRSPSSSHPNREDILDDCNNLEDTAATRGKSADRSNIGGLSDFKPVCGQPGYDCKNRGEFEEVDALTANLFPDSLRYDSSPVPAEYYLNDMELHPFVIDTEEILV
ncbi:hypothetical protein DL770_011973 [Monosporascus sp. CRB-9-2]|nr:hypothetical protein DL770_011973 [Monosporascus sp. CRB-9-2]